ncbi:MAG TPA: LysR family transcriptional regulator [Rhizomicrobium sp.]|nr:LysR family transcriptional regulator [Rhizomicrobium sp.]
MTIRIDFANGSALGPGKVRLLELVAETGSIRKAAAGMKMSYRRAWLLLKALDEAFGAPLVSTATGGKAGGGALLTALGRQVVRQYRALEEASTVAAARYLTALAKRVTAGKSRKPAKKRSIKR